MSANNGDSYKLNVTSQKNNMTFRAHLLTAESTLNNPWHCDAMHFDMFVAMKAACLKYNWKLCIVVLFHIQLASKYFTHGIFTIGLHLVIYTASESVCYSSLCFSFIRWCILAICGNGYYFAIEYPISCLFKCEIAPLFIYWNIELSLLLLSFLSFKLEVIKMYSLHILSELDLPVSSGWWPGTVIVVLQEHIQIIVLLICAFIYLS